MIHYLIVGATILVGIVAWLGVTGLLGYAGFMLVGVEESYRTRWYPFALWRWTCAVLLWLLAGGVFFGTMVWGVNEASKDCAEKGGHLVTVGKTTTCVVDVYNDPR